jgi:hypothetical protein
MIIHNIMTISCPRYSLNIHEIYELLSTDQFEEIEAANTILPQRGKKHEHCSWCAKSPT